jgi:hypothetical protein
VSQSFGYIPKSGIAGSNGRSMSSFLSSLQIFFQSGCTSLHSHQQCPILLCCPELSGLRANTHRRLLRKYIIESNDVIEQLHCIFVECSLQFEFLLNMIC